MYFLDFRRSVPHVYEHATGLCLCGGQYCEVACAKSKERFRVSEILFYQTYERNNGGASGAWMSDNELQGWHC